MSQRSHFGWAVTATVVAVLALAAAGVFAGLTLQARRNLDLTKSNLGRTRTDLRQSLDQLAQRTTALTRAQQQAAAAQSAAAKAASDLAKAQGAAKLSSSRIKDLVDCVNGVFTINDLQAQGQMTQATTLNDQLRGACSRALQTADAASVSPGN